MLLHGLKHLGVFRPFELAEEGCGEHCAVEVVQNTLICIEMLVASSVHFFVFPPYDYLRLLAQNLYQNGELTPQTLGSPRNFVEIVDIRDIFQTAWQVHHPNPSPQHKTAADEPPAKAAHTEEGSLDKTCGGTADGSCETGA